MRTFFVRRKDLDHVPFQYYVSVDGAARPLPEGYTAVFSIMPPKNDIDVFYVRILKEFADEINARWNISQAELLLIAAKGVEAWLSDESIPEDHYFGPEWLKVDRDWYPRDPDGSPAMAVNPYDFAVVSNEDWPSIADWAAAGDTGQPTQDSPAESPAEELAPLPAGHVDHSVRVVFGFTYDVFPAMLIVGYEKLKHRFAEAGVSAQVTMAPLADLPPAIDVLFVPAELADQARSAAPGASVRPLDDLVNSTDYVAVTREWARPPAGETA